MKQSVKPKGVKTSEYKGYEVTEFVDVSAFYSLHYNQFSKGLTVKASLNGLVVGWFKSPVAAKSGVTRHIKSNKGVR